MALKFARIPFFTCPVSFPGYSSLNLRQSKTVSHILKKNRVPIKMEKSGVTKVILMPKVSYREWE
jgi:hypothetical protein